MRTVRVAPNVDAPEQVRIKTPTWLDLAACASLGADNHPDLELAFASHKANGEGQGDSPTQDARRFINRYCGRCPVLAECASMRERTDSRWGVWGGVMWIDGEPAARMSRESK